MVSPRGAAAAPVSILALVPLRSHPYCPCLSRLSCSVACGDLSGDSGNRSPLHQGSSRDPSPCSCPLVPLPLAFALALVDSADVHRRRPVSVSRAMMLLVSSRTRRYVEKREACMSKWSLRSSSSMPFWTTAIFTRSDKTSPQVRSYLLTFTSNSSSEPRTSPLKVCARTSSSNDVSLPAVARSYSATNLRQLRNPSPSPACSNKRCADPSKSSTNF